MKKHLRIVTQKMCEAIGVDMDTIDFQKPEWYRDYGWTLGTSQEFSQWMQDYLYNNKEARQELMLFPSRLTIEIRTFVNGFLAQVGWRTIFPKSGKPIFH